MKNMIKTILAFTLLAIVCIAGFLWERADRLSDTEPEENTMIRLYGEAHGEKVYYDIETDLWQDCYDQGYRNLFVELPYYSAEFLNLWMKESSDELLDVWFTEIGNTLSGNQRYYDFFKGIKTNCPETVFYGTDVGHQGETTGKRYLSYLEEHGLKDSGEYRLAEECIRQGVEFYQADTQGNGMSEVREAYMVSNFKEAYERCGQGKIMGIYGSYHTDLRNPDLMAGRLKAYYGDVISSVKLSTIASGAIGRDPYALGFCVSGAVFLVMLLVPNFIWAKGRQPAGYQEAAEKENRILLLLERTGQVLATVSVLVFPALDPLIKKLPEGIYFRGDLLIWIAAFILMVLYEFYWIRFFRSRRTMKDLYSSFAGFPLAGAVLPVLALFLLGIYAKNLVVIVSAVILGIGHIGIHLMHYKEACLKEKGEAA